MNLEELNRLAEEAGYNDLFCHAIEVQPWGEKTSTTTFFDKDQNQPIQLNPIIACHIKDLTGGKCKVPSDYKGVVAVHRAALSYGAVSRIKNLADLKETLKPIINAGIIDLQNNVGFMHGMRITMKHDPSGTYFREMENAAGLELRIYVIKE